MSGQFLDAGSHHVIILQLENFLPMSRSSEIKGFPVEKREFFLSANVNSCCVHQSHKPNTWRNNLIVICHMIPSDCSSGWEHIADKYTHKFSLKYSAHIHHVEITIMRLDNQSASQEDEFFQDKAGILKHWKQKKNMLHKFTFYLVVHFIHVKYRKFLSLPSNMYSNKTDFLFSILSHSL